MFVFYLQLEQPSEAEVIRMMSYNTIRSLSPYLLSPKCAHAFGTWVRENQMLGIVITKEEIIHYITDLEVHLEFKNTQPRQIPGHLISTTLNLPPGEAEIMLSARVATPTLPKPEHPVVPSSQWPDIAFGEQTTGVRRCPLYLGAINASSLV